jgi:hypothetical protein
MALPLEDLATKFESFDLMMKKVLNKVTGLEAWKSFADASMDSLLSKANDNTSRLQQLELAASPAAATSASASAAPATTPGVDRPVRPQPCSGTSGELFCTDFGVAQ